MSLVLASGSPRRRDLLTSLGLDFEISVPGVDESPLEDEAPEAYVRRLACEKALAVAAPGLVVLAADTTVVHRGSVIGKPADPTDARRMLALLEGETHTVFTGVAVAWEDETGHRLQLEAEGSHVKLVPMTDEEIGAYVDTGEPMDKAGAYALQGIGGMFVAEVRGSPTNVIGLPLHVTVRLLRTAGVRVLGEVP